jgi:preprotein translocase subunit SecG
MQVMMNLVLLLQLVTAIVMIGLVLMQHGKGADMGAAFGGGSSGSLFGATGSANFLSRSTAVAATLFFVCTLALAYFGNLRAAGSTGGSILDRAAAPEAVASASSAAAQIPGLVAMPAASAAAASAPASR